MMNPYDVVGLSSRITLLGAQSIRLYPITTVHAVDGVTIIGYARDLGVDAGSMVRDAYVTIHADTREALLMPNEIAAEKEQAERDAYHTREMTAAEKLLLCHRCSIRHGHVSFCDGELAHG